MLYLRHMMRSNGRLTIENAHCIDSMIRIEKRGTKLRKAKLMIGTAEEDTNQPYLFPPLQGLFYKKGTIPR